jgi:hypothetical protein
VGEKMKSILVGSFILSALFSAPAFSGNVSNTDIGPVYRVKRFHKVNVADCMATYRSTGGTTWTGGSGGCQVNDATLMASAGARNGEHDSSCTFTKKFPNDYEVTVNGYHYAYTVFVAKRVNGKFKRGDVSPAVVEPMIRDTMQSLPNNSVCTIAHVTEVLPAYDQVLGQLKGVRGVKREFDVDLKDCEAKWGNGIQTKRGPWPECRVDLVETDQFNYCKRENAYATGSFMGITTPVVGQNMMQIYTQPCGYTFSLSQSSGNISFAEVKPYAEIIRNQLPNGKVQIYLHDVR